MLVIRDRATKQPLQIFSHAARYSSNKEQLFRHDIPLALHDKDGSRRTNAHANVFDENATLTETNNTYKSDNEKLREANMKLFLRVGEHKSPEEKPEPDTPPEKRSFNNLFDEKGNIK